MLQERFFSETMMKFIEKIRVGEVFGDARCDKMLHGFTKNTS